MDNKKRVYSGEDEPASKRQHTNDEGLAAGIPQDDLEKFQKEAIWREMRQYKRRNDLVQADLDKIEKEYASLKSSFSTLDVWWDQLMDQLLPKTEEDAQNSVPPTLLFNAVSGSANFGDVLEKKNDLIKQRLGPVFKKLNLSDAGKLQESLSNLTSMLNRLRAEKDTVQGARDELQAKVDDLNERYLSVSKQLDRKESSTLSKLLESSRKPREETPSEKKEENGKENGESKDENVSEDVLRELDTVKQGFEELQAAAEKQKQQMAAQDEEILGLKKRCHKLSERLSNLPEEDLKNSDRFQSYRLKNEDLTSQVTRLKEKYNRVNDDYSSLKSSVEKEKHKIREQFDKERRELEKQKQKLENDVARIRQARDSIQGELNEKTAVEKNKIETAEHLEGLLKARDGRIKALEAELARFKPSEVNPDEVTESDVGELKKLVASLQQQNKNLELELPAMEEAFKHAHTKASAKVYDAKDMDHRMKKMTAEKAKADEKYFGAMRAKDALKTELSQVKNQLSKSNEHLSHSKESEKKHVSQIDDLNNELQREKKQVRTREDEVNQVKQQVRLVEDQLKGSQQRIRKLEHDIQNRDEEAQKQQLQHRDMEIQIEKLQRQVKTKQRFGGGDNSNQMKELRSIALCSVCSNNFKDTVIKSCGHTLCNDCAQDRIAARMRKCPMCNKQCSSSDFLAIHL